MFTYYDSNNAPEKSKELMKDSKASFGMIPNVHKVLAAAPITYEAYNKLFDLFGKSSLTPLEQQVVYMTANFENRCHYCIPAHTWIMKEMKMPENVIQSLRDGTPLSDAKLQALHDFTKDLLDYRGHVGQERLEAFLEAGYTKGQALEVLTGLSAKLISNFTNALAGTKLDKAMEAYAWQDPNH